MTDGQDGVPAELQALRHGGSTPAATGVAASPAAVVPWGYAVLRSGAFIGETRAYRDAIPHASARP